MARSHHRKKHKEHVRSFKSSHDRSVTNVNPKNKVSGKLMFSIAGLILGLAIGYFASGSILWMGIGAVAGTLCGYWIGKRIDAERSF